MFVHLINFWANYIQRPQPKSPEVVVEFLEISPKCPDITLPETNIAPANGPSPKESSLQTINFQVRAVSFREGILFAQICYGDVVATLGQGIEINHRSHGFMTGKKKCYSHLFQKLDVQFSGICYLIKL